MKTEFLLISPRTMKRFELKFAMLRISLILETCLFYCSFFKRLSKKDNLMCDLVIFVVNICHEKIIIVFSS